MLTLEIQQLRYWFREMSRERAREYIATFDATSNALDTTLAGYLYKEPDQAREAIRQQILPLNDLANGL